MKRKLLTALALIIGVLLNIPLLIMLNASLSTYQDLLKWPIEWFNPPLQWSNYWQILTGDKSIVTALLNSLVVAVVTMLTCVIVAVLAAYSTSRFRYWGRKGFLYIILLMQMFSPVLLASPLYVIFSRMNLLDSRISLMIANSASCLPMTIWLLYSYFKFVPVYLEEAARLDGCSRMESLLYIVLPIAKPGIITAGVFAFISAWGDLVFARTSIISIDNYTMPLALLRFEELYQTRWELQLAASTISMLPIFCLFMLIQNKLGQGLMQTSSKE